MRKKLTQCDVDNILRNQSPGYVFNSKDLTHLKLDKKYFKGSLFYDCKLAGIEFKDCFLKKVFFVNCNLKYSLFNYCDLSESFFYNCMLNTSHFENCNIKGCKFEKTNFNDACWFSLKKGSNQIKKTNINGIDVIVSKKFIRIDGHSWLKFSKDNWKEFMPEKIESYQDEEVIRLLGFYKEHKKKIDRLVISCDS